MSLKQPVQYPVKYYSHLDAGAPQLADIDGNIKTILKAGLVTGIGTKAGAGWTSLFEDDFRIVLRRPLRTGNPPDIKIENGVINGTVSHRIVSQDNPTGLNDATELASVNLLARDSKHGTEWHLIVSDFGFMLCYQMAEYGATQPKNYILYCGSFKKINNADGDYFLAFDNPKVGKDGKGQAWMPGFLDSDLRLKNMRTGAVGNQRSFLNIGVSERYFNNDYSAQAVIVLERALAPFYISISQDVTDMLTKQVTIDDRLMLRYVHKLFTASSNRAVYIPLDYWEL